MRCNYKPSAADGFRYMQKDLKLWWDRNGGKVCSIAGTTGFILTGVHACRKTYRIHDELQDNGKRISARKASMANEKWYKRALAVGKEVAIIGVKTGKKYAADVVGGVLSGFAIKNGWQHEHGNYQKAAAMVGVLAADFMNYRMNVIDEQGKEADLRYLTRKKESRKIESVTTEDGTKPESVNSAIGSDEGITVQLDPNHLRILYSKHITPQVWSPSHALRLNHLEGIRNDLDYDLMYGGFFTVNDVRRHFFGKRGDVPEGGMFGRIWDPGNPEHPERGRRVNLHYEDDEDFMTGRKDWCWVEIEIDEEPLTETAFRKNAENFTPVEDV